MAEPVNKCKPSDATARAMQRVAVGERPIHAEGWGTGMNLTEKQEKFCHLLVSGMNQSDAYRGAYSAGKMAESTIHVSACQLAANHKVANRIEALRAPVIAKLRYGLEQAMIECKEGMEMAKENKHSSAYISAVSLRAKLNGLDVEPRKNDRGAFSEMTDDDLARAMVEVDTAIERAKKHAV